MKTLRRHLILLRTQRMEMSFMPDRQEIVYGLFVKKNRNYLRRHAQSGAESLWIIRNKLALIFHCPYKKIQTTLFKICTCKRCGKSGLDLYLYCAKSFGQQSNKASIYAMNSFIKIKLPFFIYSNTITLH